MELWNWKVGLGSSGRSRLGSSSSVGSQHSAVVSVYFTVLNPFVLCSGCLYLSILQVYFLFCNK